MASLNNRYNFPIATITYPDGRTVEILVTNMAVRHSVLSEFGSPPEITFTGVDARYLSANNASFDPIYSDPTRTNVFGEETHPRYCANCLSKNVGRETCSNCGSEL